MQQMILIRNRPNDPTIPQPNSLPNGLETALTEFTLKVFDPSILAFLAPTQPSKLIPQALFLIFIPDL